MNKYSLIVEVCEKGSISKVADEMSYSQPAVSQAILSVEKELGFPLFRRMKTGVTLTAEGERIFPFFQKIAEEEDSMLQMARSITNLEYGSIHIGMLPSVGRHWMPDIIKQFSEKYPSTEYELYYGLSKPIQKELCEGRIDCGVMTSLPENNEIEFTPLYEDEFVVLLPEGDPLAGQEFISIEELREKPMIMPVEWEESDIKKIFDKYQIEANIRLRGQSEIGIVKMVERGLGIVVQTELSLRGISLDRVICRKLSEHCTRVLGIAVRRNQKQPVLMERFIDSVKNYVKREREEI